MSKPLAERMRPQSLDEMVGQEQLTGPNGSLQRFIQQGRLPSIILWGPPGSGKTTLAHVISKELNMRYFALSAINTGVKELRKVIIDAKDQGLFNQQGTLLFIDEIHRFNKGQQDALLEAVEKGQISLIGATTENPSFAINNALLSRCLIFQLKALNSEDLKALIERALEKDIVLKQKDIKITEYASLIAYSGGDARKLLGILEYLSQVHSEEKLLINNALVKEAFKNNSVKFDKKGEFHYDTVSAFIKSVRGSHIDASLLYLAKMLIAGEDPKFIARRLVILAAEDIGLANPNALLLANSGMDAVHKLGMPEARIVLSQITCYLAASPKSNSAYVAINKAIESVRENGEFEIPIHLRNASSKLMKELNYGTDYLYPHDYPAGYIEQEYMPTKFIGYKFFEFGDNNNERRIQKNLKDLKGKNRHSRQNKEGS